MSVKKEINKINCCLRMILKLGLYLILLPVGFQIICFQEAKLPKTYPGFHLEKYWHGRLFLMFLSNSCFLENRVNKKLSKTVMCPY